MEEGRPALLKGKYFLTGQQNCPDLSLFVGMCEGGKKNGQHSSFCWYFFSEKEYW